MEYRVGTSKISLYPCGQIPEFVFVGRFEKTELKLVSMFLRPGMHVVDVGANVGLYSVLASRLVGESGRVWCFEPSSENAQRLHRNLKANACANVDVIQKALSERDGGYLTLRSDPGSGDGERYIWPERRETPGGTAFSAGDADVEQVPVTSLDAWWSEERDKIESIDFVKMDVEGAELAVCRGSVETLSSNRNVVMMLECEAKHCSRYGHTQSDVFRFIEDQGFQLFGYDAERRKWSSDRQLLLSVGNVWACRSPLLLPKP